MVELQQFHAREVIRGLAGTGTYRLQPGFPVTESLTAAEQFVVQPSEIVATLQAPSAEVQLRNFIISCVLLKQLFVAFLCVPCLTRPIKLIW